MLDIVARNRQSIEDIALQYYGAVEGVEWLLTDNRDLLADGFDSTLHEGDVLRIREGQLLDIKVRRGILEQGLVPAMDDYVRPLPDGPDHNDDYNEDHG